LEVYWNDGFEDRTFLVDSTILISNSAPVADFTSKPTAGCSINYLFTSTSSDLEGPIIYYQWTLVKLPELEIISTLGGDLKTSFEYGIAEKGTYRILLTVTDEGGLSTTKSTDFEVTSLECCDGTSSQTIVNTMYAGGGGTYGASLSGRRKPEIKAKLIAEKEWRSPVKIGGGIVDIREKKKDDILWKSTLIEERRSGSN
jgi:PKD repeat protein